MSVIVYDSFTDTDGTLLTAHTGEIGATWTNHPSSTANTLAITDNAAYQSNAGGNDTFDLASGTPPTAEYDVEASYIVKGTDNSRAGVLARADTTVMTWYRVFYNNFDWNLEVVQAGVVTNLGQYAVSYAAGTVLSIRLEIKDATKKFSINGIELISSTNNAITAVGKTGIQSVGAGTPTTGQHIGSFRVSDPNITLTTPPGLFDREAVSGGLFDDAGIA